jgi:hypothetical protein
MVDNDHKGREKSKSEIIYLQNNQIFDVVNILNLYFIFMNLELIVLIHLTFLILFQHWKECNGRNKNLKKKKNQ